MAQETLEEKVNKSNAKTSIWDFLVSAYSSNKTIKIGLTLIGMGYSYLSSALASGIFYFGAKTIGITAKYAVQFLTHPLKYLKNFSFKGRISEAAEFYNPFGRYKRPTFMGGTLSAVTYFTGF